MKHILPILALLAASCGSVPPEPTREPQIVFITSTPTLASGAAPTEEPLPFRDLSTPTSTATAKVPSPTSAPVTATFVVAIPTQSPGHPATQAPASPTARPPTQPTAAAVQPPSDVSGAEQAVIELTNSYRAQNGLAPLTRDEGIMSIARSRSADMVARGYFGHTDPITGAPLAKPQVIALGYGRAGENIYWSGAPLANFPSQAVNWFLGDPPHRANILGSGYTAIGVGIVWNGLGWTLTQNFGGP